MDIKRKLDTIYETTEFSNDRIIHRTYWETDSVLLPDVNDPMIPSSKAAGDSGLNFSPAHIFCCHRSEPSFVPVCIVILYYLDYRSSSIKYFMQSEGTPVKLIANTCTPKKPYGIVFRAYHSKCIGLTIYYNHSFWKTEKKSRLALIISFFFLLSWCPLQIIKGFVVGY